MISEQLRHFYFPDILHYFTDKGYLKYTYYPNVNYIKIGLFEYKELRNFMIWLRKNHRELFDCIQIIHKNNKNVFMNKVQKAQYIYNKNRTIYNIYWVNNNRGELQ